MATKEETTSKMLLFTYVIETTKMLNSKIESSFVGDSFELIQNWMRTMYKGKKYHYLQH